MAKATTDDAWQRSGRSRGPTHLKRVAAALVVLALLAAGCGGTGVATPTTEAPRPAGATPSAIAKQVCAHEAQADIASALGVTATVSTPTWVDHLYSCTYRYPTGSMELSVKELSSWAQTLAYFDRLGDHMGRARSIANIGQGAFQTTDGSMVVRKDWKVLLVDAAGLPSQFGVPPTSSGDVAVTVADVILGCWAGD
jgi:hypothetical protein